VAGLRDGVQGGIRGKLRWAARAWVAGGLTRPAREPGAIADARRLGWSEAAIADLRGRLGAAGAGVWPQNSDAVSAFLAVATQWRTTLAPGPRGARLVWLGLDYAAAKVALDAVGIAVTAELWAALTIMELAARAALNGE
jgi:hypothetical protein